MEGTSMSTRQPNWPVYTLACLCFAVASSGHTDVPQSPVQSISWADNMLTIEAPAVPGGKIDIWYLEAFCRTGSTDRVWSETVIPHETTLAGPGNAVQRIQLVSNVEPGVRVTHDIRAVGDGVTFDVTLENTTRDAVDVDWAQPCMRVGAFTDRGQETYHERCFIFTASGKVMLDALPRTEEARYRGGQVYVPEGINLDDVNPRPISTERPVKNLIGAESGDGNWLVAMAWDQTQELFQGVIICIHADFRVGGLKAGETKRLWGKVYLMKNDSDALLAAYQRDFASKP